MDGEFGPDNLEFVVLSFEGPDQPYSQAGGLGVRVTHLTATLARLGFVTHLFFVGDPELPGYEEREGGRLKLYRWCQWQSRYHRGGVYDNENWKVSDFQETVPWYVTDRIVRPAAQAGKYVAIIAEEWHTAETLARLSDSLNFLGMRDRCILMWNANNDMSFHRMNWGRVSFVASLTAVSRYVKHQVRAMGYDAIVLPNGIPSSMLKKVPVGSVRLLRGAVETDYLFFKIGRMDPDKGWLEALDAMADLVRGGSRAVMLMKGGRHELHREHFLGHARWLGLAVREVRPPSASLEDVVGAVQEAAREADVIDIQIFMPDTLLPTFYAAADASLANSLYEPFGLVGLEAMASGGIAFVGSTGEDYAVGAQSAVVLDTGYGYEIAALARRLRASPEWAASIRKQARKTAALFTWEKSIEIMLLKLPLMARQQGVA